MSGAAVVRAALALLAVLTACGGPLGPLHGGRLAGVPVATPVRDWSFAEAYPLMQIETRPDDPYSVNVNFVVAGGCLYVDIGQPDDWNRWRQLIRADPRVRVRFGDHVYAAHAVPVTDGAEHAAVAAAYQRRHGDPPAADATFVRLE